MLCRAHGPIVSDTVYSKHVHGHAIDIHGPIDIDAKALSKYMAQTVSGGQRV
jgi:hypothetical protein